MYVRQCAQEPVEKMRASDPWTGVTGSSEPPCGCRWLNSAPLREQWPFNLGATSLTPQNFCVSIIPFSFLMMIILHTSNPPELNLILTQFCSSTPSVLSHGGEWDKNTLCIFVTNVQFNAHSLLSWPVDLNVFTLEGCLKPPTHLTMCWAPKFWWTGFCLSRALGLGLTSPACSLMVPTRCSLSGWRILMFEVEAFVECLHTESLDICAFSPSSFPRCNSRQAACIALQANLLP